MNVNDIVVKGWGSEFAQAVHADPEMRVLVARVIEATQKLVQASGAQLAAAIDEQNAAVAALNHHVLVKKSGAPATKPDLVMETS